MPRNETQASAFSEVVSARFEAGSRERRHATDNSRLVLMLEGAASLRLGAEGQLCLTTPDLLLVPSNVAVTMQPLANARWLQLEFADSGMGHLLLRDEGFYRAIARRMQRKHAMNGDVYVQCEHVTSLRQSLERYADKERARAPGRGFAHRDQIWRRLWRARVFGEANAHRRISMSELAAQAFCSPWHFQRQFQAVFGEAPGYWLDRRRFRRALDLVQKTHLPVSKVANATGYDDASVFSRWFRNHAGMSAAHLRRKALAA